jgi:hypothetical protein
LQTSSQCGTICLPGRQPKSHFCHDEVGNKGPREDLVIVPLVVVSLTIIELLAQPIAWLSGLVSFDL